MAATTFPMMGQLPSEHRFALTVGQVARTLSDRGILMTGKRLTLLAKVVASEPDPALDVLSVEPLNDLESTVNTEIRSRVKLACHLPGTCLPFYALMTCPREPGGSTPNGPGKFLTKDKTPSYDRLLL